MGRHYRHRQLTLQERRGDRDWQRHRHHRRTTKFGTGSCVFPGVNQYLQYPDSPDWTFSGDYTIDFWVRLFALPASGTAYC